MVYWTSDLHLYDTNVYEYTRKHLFRSEESMVHYIADRWIYKAGDKDTVIVTGDVGICNDKCLTVLSKLTGHKILVLGNHDEDHLDDLYEIFDYIVYIYYINLDGIYICNRHEPLLKTSMLRQGCDIFVHGHHHVYDEMTWRHGVYYLRDPYEFNSCTDLNWFEPSSLTELKYNKPYQLQFFEKEWYKI